MKPRMRGMIVVRTVTITEEDKNGTMVEKKKKMPFRVRVNSSIPPTHHIYENYFTNHQP